ncbi:hypothetical protein GGS20DRAFT_532657 [Poronia punctata]|nr:hypothetical protein GGS20DRAFT_532657 [Poronia punctata]
MSASFLSDNLEFGRAVGNAEKKDVDSEYGSDFSVGEEELVEKLIQELGSRDTSRVPKPTVHSQNEAENHIKNGQPRTLRSNAAGIPVSTVPADWKVADTSNLEYSDTSSHPVGYPDLSRVLSTLEPEAQGVKQPATETNADTRSPLQRFRTFPKRPLTVTDMAAGAWCELQYWYTLTRLPGGKRTRTPAMRAGTRVHQTLEDQVHTAVQVNIASKEEAFALRLWNVVQGLRTLRETGLTREMEVWGQVQGEILNGVIDQLTHTTPNASFEEELRQASQDASQQQSSITDFLESGNKTVYLTDIKTRASDRLPTGIALRPARVQLFLYHRLLSDMASDKLDYSVILERYGLNEEARFSDAFMAQIGELHDEIFYDADSEVESTSQNAQSPDLLDYRSLSQIIPLLKAEMKLTFPRGSASIGDLLAVQYRHRDDGRILGNNSFPNDAGALDGYMEDNLGWWRGQREPRGVAIEETYKCNYCEFAEVCQWRKDREAEFLEMKKAGRTARKAPSTSTKSG